MLINEAFRPIEPSAYGLPLSGAGACRHVGYRGRNRHRGASPNSGLRGEHGHVGEILGWVAALS
jgi:hypothetical protein